MTCALRSDSRTPYFFCTRGGPASSVRWRHFWRPLIRTFSNSSHWTRIRYLGTSTDAVFVTGTSARFTLILHQVKVILDFRNYLHYAQLCGEESIQAAANRL